MDQGPLASHSGGCDKHHGGDTLRRYQRAFQSNTAAQREARKMCALDRIRAEEIKHELRKPRNCIRLLTRLFGQPVAQQIEGIALRCIISR